MGRSTGPPHTHLRGDSPRIEGPLSGFLEPKLPSSRGNSGGTELPADADCDVVASGSAMDPTDDPAALGSQGLSQLDQLVIDYLDHLEERGEDRLLDLCDAHPDSADALKERVAALRNAGLLQSVDATGPPQQLGDFKLGRRLGQGGMGVVYLAEQSGMGRRVALKLLHPGAHHLPGARARFSREIEAVARLSHPGIVPIHTHGEAGEIPYYAMAYVEGTSLSELIRSVEDKDPKDLRGFDLLEALAGLDGRGPLSQSDENAGRSLFQGSWVETCLRIMRQVASALDHAHARGVFHRDIKPSNIMLTRDGRVMLVDFGLAGLTDVSRLTVSGAQLGSLPYLPPEQLKGESQSTDARHDIYGLGVTLYELLTLHLPFDSGRLEVLQRQIVEAHPIRPRTWNPAIPVDAETVCLKAMAPEVDRRYPTAEDLTRDLIHVLELRPIDARAPGPVLRFQRYVQRNPARAAAAGLAAMLLIGGPLGFGVQASRAAGKLRTAKGATDLANLELKEKNAALAASLAAVQLQSQRAEGHYADARRALDLLTDVAQEHLADIPFAEDAQREILQATLGFYRGLADREGDDDDSRRDIAVARARVAELKNALGETAEALELATSAIDALLEVDADPGHLAEAYSTRASARRDGGDLAGAVEDATEAVRYAEQVEEGGRFDPIRTLSRQQTALASAYLARGQYEESVQASQSSMDTIQPLIDAGTLDAEFTYRHAMGLYQHGISLIHSGHSEDALSALEEAVGLFDDLLEIDADRRAYRTAQLGTLSSIARAFGDVQRLADSEEYLDRAVDMGEGLVSDFPGLTKPVELLSNAHSNRAVLHFQSGRAGESTDGFRRSIELIDLLAAQNPDNARFIGRQSQARASYGALLSQLDRAEEGVEVLARGIELSEGGLARFPGEPNLEVARADLHINMSFSQVLLGNHGEAWAAIDPMHAPKDMHLESLLTTVSWALPIVQGDPGLSEESKAEHMDRLSTLSLDLLEASMDRGLDMNRLRASAGNVFKLSAVKEWLEPK